MTYALVRAFEGDWCWMLVVLQPDGTGYVMAEGSLPLMEQLKWWAERSGTLDLPA